MRIWIPHLHKIGPIGNLGRNLWNVTSPLSWWSALSVSTWGCASWVCKLFSWIKSLSWIKCFLFPHLRLVIFVDTLLKSHDATCLGMSEEGSLRERTGVLGAVCTIASVCPLPNGFGRGRINCYPEPFWIAKSFRELTFNYLKHQDLSWQELSLRGVFECHCLNKRYWTYSIPGTWVRWASGAKVHCDVTAVCPTLNDADSYSAAIKSALNRTVQLQCFCADMRQPSLF